MPGRSYSSGILYRFGFNGKENDNDVKGTANQQDYGMRVYDARVGRFLSVDPLQKKYPWYTSYQFAGNTPIQAVDLDGLEEYYYSALWNNKTGKVELKLEKTVDQKSFLGIKWTPSKEITVTFSNSDGDKTNYSFTPEGHIVRNNGINEHVNTIASFEAFKKGSADKVYSSEEDAEFDFGGDGGAGGFYSNGALAINLIGNASKDFHDHGGAYTLNANVNNQVTRVNNGNPNAAASNTASDNESPSGQRTILYHYTTEEGQKGILSSKTLNVSTKATNPSDARYGDGQYLSDITPGTKTPAQLSRAFLNIPYQGKRFTNYVAIDVTGLNVVKGRDGVYVIPNSNSLNLVNRIVGSGSVQGASITTNQTTTTNKP